MNSPETKFDAHSADVRIYLHVNGSVLPVAQLGPSFLVLRRSSDHPPCEAEISLSIDGDEKRWTVHLTNGIQVGRRKTAITPCSDG
ncbi:MAG: hypothetical protein ACYC3I_23535 [Gemmataceae bacterium]